LLLYYLLTRSGGCENKLAALFYGAGGNPNCPKDRMLGPREAMQFNFEVQK
jgi:hypothetical protein